MFSALLLHAKCVRTDIMLSIKQRTDTHTHTPTKRKLSDLHAVYVSQRKCHNSPSQTVTSAKNIIVTIPAGVWITNQTPFPILILICSRAFLPCYSNVCVRRAFAFRIRLRKFFTQIISVRAVEKEPELHSFVSKQTSEEKKN